MNAPITRGPAAAFVPYRFRDDGSLESFALRRLFESWAVLVAE